jgi:hypothetical protein
MNIVKHDVYSSSIVDNQLNTKSSRSISNYPRHSRCAEADIFKDTLNIHQMIPFSMIRARMKAASVQTRSTLSSTYDDQCIDASSRVHTKRTHFDHDEVSCPMSNDTIDKITS